MIGESSTPLSNLLLDDLATRYDLPAIRPLTKWGSWQQTYPRIACGVKRGFTFYHHDLGQPDARTRNTANSSWLRRARTTQSGHPLVSRGFR